MQLNFLGLRSVYHETLISLVFQKFLFHFKPALLVITSHASTIIFFNNCFGFSVDGLRQAMFLQNKSTMFTLFGSSELLMIAELGVSSAEPVSLVIWIKFKHFRGSKDVVVFRSEHLRLSLRIQLLRWWWVVRRFIHQIFSHVGIIDIFGNRCRWLVFWSLNNPFLFDHLRLIQMLLHVDKLRLIVLNLHLTHCDVLSQVVYLEFEFFKLLGCC